MLWKCTKIILLLISTSVEYIKVCMYILQKREWFQRASIKEQTLTIDWKFSVSFDLSPKFDQFKIFTKIDQFKNWTMEDQLMFFTFLVCMIICNSISLILYKYQKTISPINQSIIDKLSFFCIFCLNLINSNQVGLEQENNKVTTFFYFRD